MAHLRSLLIAPRLITSLPTAPPSSQKRRIYDITNVLEGIGLISKSTKVSCDITPTIAPPQHCITAPTHPTQNNIEWLGSNEDNPLVLAAKMEVKGLAAEVSWWQGHPPHPPSSPSPPPVDSPFLFIHQPLLTLSQPTMPTRTPPMPTRTRTREPQLNAAKFPPTPHQDRRLNKLIAEVTANTRKLTEGDSAAMLHCTYADLNMIQAFHTKQVKYGGSG